MMVVVADVAGKSVPAALLMATFQSGVRALASTTATLDEVVIGLERYARALRWKGGGSLRRFWRRSIAGRAKCVTRIAGTTIRSCGTLQGAGTAWRGRTAAGIPVLTEMEFLSSASVTLAPGDLLFVFTDGLVEAVNEKGEEFKEERLLRSIEAGATGNAAEILARVMNDVNTFVGFARQHDDITRWCCG